MNYSIRKNTYLMFATCDTHVCTIQSSGVWVMDTWHITSWTNDTFWQVVAGCGSSLFRESLKRSELVHRSCIGREYLQLFGHHNIGSKRLNHTRFHHKWTLRTLFTSVIMHACFKFCVHSVLTWYPPEWLAPPHDVHISVSQCRHLLNLLPPSFTTELSFH